MRQPLRVRYQWRHYSSVGGWIHHVIARILRDRSMAGNEFETLVWKCAAKWSGNPGASALAFLRGRVGRYRAVRHVLYGGIDFIGAELTNSKAIKEAQREDWEFCFLDPIEEAEVERREFYRLDWDETFCVHCGKWLGFPDSRYAHLRRGAYRTCRKSECVRLETQYDRKPFRHQMRDPRLRGLAALAYDLERKANDKASEVARIKRWRQELTDQSHKQGIARRAV